MFSQGLTLLAQMVSTVFNPISNFASGEKGLWLDPSDFSTMSQDNATVVPVTAVGQRVGAILDKSGNGNYAYQPDYNKRPILRVNGFGNYYLEFDGVDDFLFLNSDFTLGGTNKLTFHFGIKYYSNGIVLETSSNGFDVIAGNGKFFVYAGTDGSHTGYESFSGGTVANAGAVVQLGTFSPPDLAVITFTHSIPDSLSTGRRNQVAGTDAIASKGTGTFHDYQTYIGSRAGTGLFCEMDLYCLIIRGGVSGPTLINNNENWINGKTGAY